MFAVMWSDLLLNVVVLVSAVMVLLLLELHYSTLHYIRLGLHGSLCMQSKVQVAPDSPMQQAPDSPMQQAPDSPIQHRIVFFSFPGVISSGDALCYAC